MSAGRVQRTTQASPSHARTSRRLPELLTRFEARDLFFIRLLIGERAHS